MPPLAREAYTLDQFVAELAPAAGTMRPVAVHKRRVRYVIGGCTAEVSDVVADGRPTRTLAIESEDAAAVIAAVRSVGLGDYVNTSYPRGLAALIDGAPPRYAVIDVGTNSIKFHVGERGADGTWRAVVDRAEVTRLGEGLEEQRRDLPRGAGADRDGDRGHGRGGEAGTAPWRSPRSGRPACASPATATPSSPPSRRAPASPSR